MKNLHQVGFGFNSLQVTIKIVKIAGGITKFDLMIEVDVMEMLTLGTATPIAVSKKVGMFSLTISDDTAKTAQEAADVKEHTAQSKRQKIHCGKQESSYDHSL